MRVRYFGLLLLIAMGIVPVVSAGLWIVNRAQETALSEVRTGNRRVAKEAAAHISTFVQSQVQILQALGAPVAKSVKLSPEQLTRILKNYRILFPKLRSLDLVGLDCTELASSRIDTVLRERCKSEPAVATAVKGKVFLGEIKL